MARKDLNGEQTRDAHATSFWKTLPGILTGLAGVLTALATLVVALPKLWDPDDGNGPEGPAAVVECRPTIAETQTLKLLPISLKNSLHGHEPLYWFKIRVENDCPHPVFLTVKFTERRGPIRARGNPAEFTIAAGESFEETIDPNLELLDDGFSEPDTSEVIWEISNDHQQILHKGTETIELLPKHVFHWDLKNAEDEPVAKEFLLASLAAWTLTGDEEISRRSNQLRELAGGGHELERWFQLCYTEVLAPLLQGASLKSWRFPPEVQTTIRPPATLLRASQAKPIEGALLLAALSRWLMANYDLDMALLVRGEGDGFFVSWSAESSSGCRWKAIEVASAAEIAFEANLQHSTQAICSLLSANPAIQRSLDDSGVFYGGGAEGPLAIDFSTAIQTFRIRGLP